LPCDVLVARLKQASWGSAIANLREVWKQGGAVATLAAEQYADVYASRRATMVFDCVMSRQRPYDNVVVPLVSIFEDTEQAASLATLAERGPGVGTPARKYPLKKSEAATIQQVAAGLHRYCQERGLDEEEGIKRWAGEAGTFELSPKEEPYVGSVNGIGIATFAYLRMRSGADAIKVDVWVKEQLGALLFPLGDGSDRAILCVAGAAAAELGVTRLQLDQLLWLMGKGRF
jgi:hypothetical protein